MSRHLRSLAPEMRWRAYLWTERLRADWLRAGIGRLADPPINLWAVVFGATATIYPKAKIRYRGLLDTLEVLGVAYGQAAEDLVEAHFPAFLVDFYTRRQRRAAQSIRN